MFFHLLPHFSRLSHKCNCGCFESYGSFHRTVTCSHIQYAADTELPLAKQLKPVTAIWFSHMQTSCELSGSMKGSCTGRTITATRNSLTYIQCEKRFPFNVGNRKKSLIHIRYLRKQLRQTEINWSCPTAGSSHRLPSHFSYCYHFNFSLDQFLISHLGIGVCAEQAITWPALQRVWLRKIGWLCTTELLSTQKAKRKKRLPTNTQQNHFFKKRKS